MERVLADNQISSAESCRQAKIAKITVFPLKYGKYGEK
jgi:hypothetical protein